MINCLFFINVIVETHDELPQKLYIYFIDPFLNCINLIFPIADIAMIELFLLKAAARLYSFYFIFIYGLFW